MQRSLIVSAIVAGLLVSPSFASAQAQTTLHACQKAARKETAKYAKQYVKVVGSCMDAISNAVIVENAPTEGAAAACQKAFAKLLSSSKPESTLAAKLAGKIKKVCAPPPVGSAEHTEADILGTSGSGEDLSTVNLDTWCSDFGGSGTIGNLDGWVSCLTEAGTCAARETLATAYPRLIEWLRRVQLDIARFDPSCDFTCSATCTDPAVIDACNAIKTVQAAIDGTPVDELPDVACGPGRARPASPLRTGETTCHDESGATISCAGTGMDGETQLGEVHDYEFDNTVPAERTLIDHSTGLEWEVQCDEDPEDVASKCPTLHDVDTMFSLAQGYDKVAQLNAANYGGHNDWRIPNIIELLTLQDYGVYPPVDSDYLFTAGCSVLTSTTPCSVSECSCSHFALFYLSSTSFADNPQGVWVILPYDGRPIPIIKGVDGSSSPVGVRAVRGGS